MLLAPCRWGTPKQSLHRGRATILSPSGERFRGGGSGDGGCRRGNEEERGDDRLYLFFLAHILSGAANLHAALLICILYGCGIGCFFFSLLQTVARSWIRLFLSPVASRCRVYLFYDFSLYLSVLFFSHPHLALLPIAC